MSLLALYREAYGGENLKHFHELLLELHARRRRWARCDSLRRPRLVRGWESVRRPSSALDKAPILAAQGHLPPVVEADRVLFEVPHGSRRDWGNRLRSKAPGYRSSIAPSRPDQSPVIMTSGISSGSATSSPSSSASSTPVKHTSPSSITSLIGVSDLP